MAKMDREEREILESFNKGEWSSVKNLKSKRKKYRAYAKETLKKNKRINIRVSSKDLEDIQKIAIEEGLPYQTFIASILHKYISGRIRDDQPHV